MAQIKDINQMLADHGREGDLDGMKKLLSKGANPNENESEALRLAAKNGHVECVRLLILFSDPKSASSYALRWAARNGHAECVRLLIPVSNPEACGSMPLCVAAEKGHAECVRLLIPVSNHPKDISDALSWAARYDRTECVKLLISAAAANPAVDHLPAICWAIEYGSVESLMLLISNPAILNACDPANARQIDSILSAAFNFGEARMLSLMLAQEPRLLDGLDLLANADIALAKGHSELSSLLRSIIDKQALSAQSLGPASGASPAALRRL